MSDNYKHTWYSKRQLGKQYLNGICGMHDLWCGCDDPLKHTATLIFEEAKPTNFSTKDQQTIKKCLGEETTATETGDQDDGFEGGDLDRLFAIAAEEGEKE